MRRLVIAALLAATSLTTAQAGDILIHGGPIHTGVEAAPKAEAVLIRDDKILFVGPLRTNILGILKDKDIDTMLDILLRPNDTVVVTVPQSERADSAADLLRRVAPAVQHVEAFENNTEALNRALELANGEKLLVIAGSLYLVGGVRQMLLKREG